MGLNVDETSTGWIENKIDKPSSGQLRQLKSLGASKRFRPELRPSLEGTVREETEAPTYGKLTGAGPHDGQPAAGKAAAAKDLGNSSSRHASSRRGLGNSMSGRLFRSASRSTSFGVRRSNTIPPRSEADGAANAQADELEQELLRLHVDATSGQQQRPQDHDASAAAPGPRQPVVRIKSVAGRTVQLETVTAEAAEAAEPAKAKRIQSLAEAVQHVRDNVIGTHTGIEGPWGTRLITYADYTASGRMLKSVEDFMQNSVYHLYANTHTDASACGRQTMVFYEEARAIISRCVHAPPQDYATIFIGSGCTGAIDRLTQVLGLKATQIPRECMVDQEPGERAVVFVGPFEHHSNEVMWRECRCDVVAIPEDDAGLPDLQRLESELIKHQSRPLKVGSFSAGSNVTGILADCDAIARLLHKYGALACFDYAGAGPYVDIDCERAGRPGAHKDAVYISPHKYVGGPGTPGLLVARRELFAPTPTIPGGGTVSFVSPTEQRYVDSIEAREEGGTPPVLQAIRCALAFQVKEAVGPLEIERLEERLAKRVIKAWSATPSLHLVGSDRKAYHFDRRLSIISFDIMYEGTPEQKQQRMLHPHYVTALLNDLYGIQARSGCSCAGPYGFVLRPELARDADKMEVVVTQHGQESVKPGWSRVNFNYWLRDDEADFIIEAVRQVARLGWLLLPQYYQDAAHGTFKHRAAANLRLGGARLRSLQDMLPLSGGKAYRAPPHMKNRRKRRLKSLQEALCVYASAPDWVASQTDLLKEWLKPEGGIAACDVLESGGVKHCGECETLRWWPLGADAVRRMADADML